MTDGRWRTAYASVIGTSHTKTGSPCQDSGGCRVIVGADDSEIVIAAVADGAGTANRSEAGAALTVNRFLEDFAKIANSNSDLSSIDRRFVTDWVTEVCAEISELAVKEGAEVRDYACTLLAAVIGRSAGIYLQIGDGAIVVSGEKPGEYDLKFWPQHGEYANTTNFITQENAAEALEFESGRPVREIAIFSDGIERLVLDLTSKTVHSPAFTPIFAWLAGTEPDRKEQPSSALTAYLSSQHVNSRTDDDKTLVMATRAGPDPA